MLTNSGRNTRPASESGSAANDAPTQVAPVAAAADDVAVSLAGDDDSESQSPLRMPASSHAKECCGCIAGWRCRQQDANGTTQTVLVLLLSFAAFALAEAVEMSGIVASLFAGITANHLTWRVLSPSGRKTSGAVFRMLANAAETAVFF